MPVQLRPGAIVEQHPVNGNGAAKWAPIILQTIVILGAFIVYAMHEEGRISALEQGQKDLSQQVVHMEARVDAYFDRH